MYIRPDAAKITATSEPSLEYTIQHFRYPIDPC